MSRPKLARLGSKVRTASLSPLKPGSTAKGGDGYRGSSSERGYGYRWQMARRRFLDQHPLCLMCNAEGRVEAATVVDHITPHRGDQRLFWREDNWQPLCASCHSSAKQRQEIADAVL